MVIDQMTVFTPQKDYNELVATSLLSSLPQHALKAAQKRLAHASMLSRASAKEPGTKPGRPWIPSETNVQALEGPIPRRTYREAKSMVECLDGEEWNMWNVMAPGGDVAALIELVSDDKVCSRAACRCSIS